MSVFVILNGTLDVRESGSVDEFSFTWGMNISNQWYVGAELGLRSLTYSKSTYYSEVFDNGNRYNLDPMRNRKLLMHRNEITRLFSKTKLDGLTLVPTKCYFKDGKVKFEIGLARGKKDYDKRDTIAEKQAKRDIDRAMKNSRRDV